MKNIAIVLGTALAVFPNIQYLLDLRYRFDPALQSSVCRSLLCSDELLLSFAAMHMASGGDQNAGAALTALQEAVRRNVAFPYRWIDLGEAMFEAGRMADARYCYSRALELGPQTTSVLWPVAQFYMRIKEPRTGLNHMAHILEIAPENKETIFNSYLLGGADISDTLAYGIPPRTPLAHDYFRYLLSQGQLKDVRLAWDWLDNHSLPDDRLAGDYVDLLIMNREFSLAAETWKRSAGRHDGAYLRPNLVYNGDLELPSLQSGLDWQFDEVSGARTERDSTVAHSGSSSLRIEFQGTDNIDFNHVEQRVIAEAGSYHFKAWIRTSEITTDQGAGFRLLDSAGRLDLRTGALTGTNGWTPLDLDFTLTGPARLIRIQLIRRPSLKFDNKISGRVWIDSVLLVRRG
jgi:tetratricopeptide (TPR) repeat protein